jgi:hypothetical protein
MTNIYYLTWAHVIDASSAPFFAATLRRGQTEVREFDSLTIVPAEDVLRLEISVIDAELVTMRNGICKLGEHAGAKTCPAKVDLLVQNEREQVAARSEVHD